MLNWVEIDAAAIRWNIEQFRGRLGSSVLLGAVVKSNGYGHGMLEVAGPALEAGAAWLCVNNLDEAIGLRSAWPDTPVLVMGHIPLDRLEEVVEHDLRPVLYNVESIERLDRLTAGRKLPAPIRVHLKVETGTHRQGVDEADLPRLVDRIAGSSGLALEGLTTHFADIEDTTDHSFAELQIARFGHAVDRLKEEGVAVAVRHSACSAAAVLFTRTHMDLARIGISMYGIWPSKETYVSCLELGKPTLELRPAMTWKTRIAQVKTVPEDSYVGYGRKYRTTRESRIAVLPVGYYEGYDRGMSGKAHVLIRGRRAPVRGRICMNMCMVDVTDIPAAALEDEVVLLGVQGDERIPAEQLAEWSDTIAYELVSRIHPSLPRVVV